MPWQLTAFLYVLLSSLRAITNRQIGSYNKDVSMYALAASFAAVLSVGLLVALPQYSSLQHEEARSLWLNIIAGGLLFAIANVTQIKLFRFLPASVAIFLALLIPLSVVLFSAVFGQDTLNTNQIIGGLFIGMSVLVVAVLSEKNKKQSKRDHHLWLGMLAAVISALTIGPALTNEAYLIEEIGLNTYVLYGWGLQAAMSFLIAAFLWSKLDIRTLPKKVHRHVWTYSLLLGLAGFMFVSSIEGSGSINSVALTSSARVAFTLLLAYIILKEKDHLRVKLIGLALSVCGLYFLFT